MALMDLAESAVEKGMHLVKVVVTRSARYIMQEYYAAWRNVAKTS